MTDTPSTPEKPCHWPIRPHVWGRWEQCQVTTVEIGRFNNSTHDVPGQKRACVRCGFMEARRV